MKRLMVLGIALAIVGTGLLAYAADAPKAPAKDMSMTVMGKVEMKDKAAMLMVDSCMCAMDKDKACPSCAAMKGKSLKIGKMAADAEKLAGKDVEAKGTIKGDTIDLTAIAEKKAPEKKS